MNRPDEWYDFYSRTDEVLVPSKWISRLDEANAVNNQFQVHIFNNKPVYFYMTIHFSFQYLREKIEQDFPK